MLKKKTIIQIRGSLCIVALIMAALYGGNRLLLNHGLDETAPEFSFTEEFLEVSVEVTEEGLLEGVTATDQKDGDVTDTIIIESISKLLAGKERIVTYAAFDGNNNVGKAERRIQYTDYTSPRFSISEPLTTSLSLDMSEILSSIHATDCIDGDITDQIIITNTDITGLTGEEASMTIEIQVTNSCGDIASLTLPISISMSGSSSYKGIELKTYLIYTKVDEKVDLKSYIKEVADIGGGGLSSADVSVSSDLDTSEPGVYTATYTLPGVEDSTSTQLYIVVEE